jgi:hypothetical protein
MNPDTGRTRLMTHVVLGVFTLLVVGGIVLSLVISTPAAVQQLRAGAGATAQAQSFVLTDTNSIAPISGANAAALTRSMVVHVRYEAPDHLEESGIGPTGEPVSVIVVGPRHFQRQAGDARYTELPPTPNLGTEAVQTVLLPLQGAAKASSAVPEPGPPGAQGYQFLPDRPSLLITTVLGASLSQVRDLRFTAVVRGDFVTDERITAVAANDRLTVDLAFSRVGSASPVTVPATS